MQMVAWGFLVLQALIVIASLLGYGIFTSRPDLLMQVDPQARFFAWAFHGFAVGNKRSHFAAGVLTPALIKISQRGCSPPLETPFNGSTLKSAWSTINMLFGGLAVLTDAFDRNKAPAFYAFLTVSSSA